MKNKVKMLLNYRDAKQSELLNIWKVSSKQALTNKMSHDRFDLSEFVLLCDYLDMDISIIDRKTKKEILKIEKNDIGQ